MIRVIIDETNVHPVPADLEQRALLRLRSEELEEEYPGDRAGDRGHENRDAMHCVEADVVLDLLPEEAIDGGADQREQRDQEQ